MQEYSDLDARMAAAQELMEGLAEPSPVSQDTPPMVTLLKRLQAAEAALRLQAMFLADSNINLQDVIDRIGVLEKRH